MLNQFMRLIALPAFDDDRDVRAAAILCVVLGVTAVLAALVIVGTLTTGRLDTLAIFGAGGVMAEMLLAYAVLNRGHVKAAARIHLFMLWIVPTVLVVISGESVGDLAGVFTLLVFVAGLVLGRRDAHLVAGLLLITLAALLTHDLNGAPFSMERFAAARSPWSTWVSASVSVLLGLSTIVYASRLIDRTMDRLRESAELLNHVNDAVISTDLNFSILTWNAAAERLYGWATDEVVGKKISEVIPPQYYPEMSREAVLKAYREESAWSGEVVQNHKDGRAINVLSSVTAIRDAAGLPTGAVAVNRDVTERAAMNRRFHQEKAFSDAIIDSLPGMFFMFNADRRLVRWNNERERVRKMSGEQLDGMDVLEGIADEDRERLADVIERTWVDGEGHSEHTVLTADGDRVPVVGRGRRVTIDGEDYVVGISFDISELRNAQEALGRSEVRYKEFVEYSSEAIARFELEAPMSIDISVEDQVATILDQSRLAECNGSFAAFFGHDAPEGMVGVPFRDVLPPTPDGTSLGLRSFVETSYSVVLDGVRFTNSSDEERVLRSSVKGFVQDGCLTHLWVLRSDITERVEAENDLRTSEARFRALIEQSPVCTVVFGPDGRIITGNKAAADLWGASDLAIARLYAEYNLFEDPVLEEQGITPFVLRAFEGEAVQLEPSEYDPSKHPDLTRLGAKSLWVRASIYPIRDAEGQVTEVVLMHEDVTEQLRAEETVRQAQKLESLGVLSGGLAHDFNNLLTAMLGQASLALLKISDESEGRPHVERVIRAAENASDLTQQLLAYSGHGRFDVRALDLNTLVKENLPLFEVAVPRRVRLSAELGADVLPIEADMGQMQQLVMNLVMNAAEAVETGRGTVEVSTDMVTLEAGLPPETSYTGHGLPPGNYVRLRVTDDGVGMEDEVSARMFEPFFTTKATGHGLGLAAVLGYRARSPERSGGRDHASKGYDGLVVLPANVQRGAGTARAGGGGAGQHSDQRHGTCDRRRADSARSGRGHPRFE